LNERGWKTKKKKTRAEAVGGKMRSLNGSFGKKRIKGKTKKRAGESAGGKKKKQDQGEKVAGVTE